MDENLDKRWGEPKPIGDIINQMGFGENDIEKKKISCLQDKRFVNAIKKNLSAYINVIKKFETEYKKSSVIILQIEDFYNEEKKLLDVYKTLLAEKNITSKDIYNHAYIVQDKLEEFDADFTALRTTLRFIVRKFHDPEDKQKYDEKINILCSVFAQISIDITDIGFEQQQLVKKI